MKKILLMALCLLLLLPAAASAADLTITSESAVVMDAETGQVLYEKNMDKPLYPASITKILTVYLAVTHANLSDVVTASETAIKAVPRDTSNIALDYGEQLTLEQALYAAMLISANDACNVVAEHVSGSIEAFTQLMNETAQSFGAVHSHFSNANGLIAEDHYTTAYDFARITQAAIQNPDFFKIFSSLEYTIGPTNKKSDARNFVAQHRMTHQAQYAEYNVLAGKAGFTSESQHTLVTYGEKNGMKIIVVALKNPNFNNIYKDTEALLLHGYQDFQRITVSGSQLQPKTEKRAVYTPGGSFSCLIPKDLSSDQLVYTYGEDTITVATPDQAYLGQLPLTKTVVVPLGEKILKVVLIILGILVALFVFLYLSLIVSGKKKKKRRRQRRSHRQM